MAPRLLETQCEWRAEDVADPTPRTELLTQVERDESDAAVEHARAVGAGILGIVSRSGGRTRELADVTVLVPVVADARITPHAEGWQGVLWHLWVNALAEC